MVSSGSFSDIAHQKVISKYNFNSLDIAFITELAFGCIRYRKFLDLWIDHTSKFTHKKQPPKLRWLLHIGLYQLLKMNKVPSSAAISTTVEIAKESDLSGLAGTVNAILRNVVEKLNKKCLPFIPVNDISRISYEHSLPEWIVKEIINWYGLSKAEDIAKAFNKRPSIDIRVNTLKTNSELLLEEFKSSNLKVEPIEEIKNGIQLLTKPRNVKDLPGYNEGKWLIQDRSSQWVASLLKPCEKDRILDACAAPGSKTTHIAQITNDKSEIWALDRSEIRLKILKSNLSRLKIKSVRAMKADAIDFFNQRPDLRNYFNKILVDAPCSGMGTFARNPDSKWNLNKTKIKELSELQLDLLNSVLPLLKIDGSIVYSTCSICPAENNILIRKFLDKNRSLKLISEKQILPSYEQYGDGFYAAVIRYIN